MKFWKQTLLLSFAFIAILVTIIHTSCERNVCNNVTCFNGGSCSGGTCLCPLGYEGPQCGSLSITRYLGTYYGYIKCDDNAQLFDTAVIKADGVAINTVSIAVASLKPKILHGYVSSNSSTYSVIITNNDSLSTDSTIYDKTFTATVQNDITLSLNAFTRIENKNDSINTHCQFLGQKQ